MAEKWRIKVAKTHTSTDKKYPYKAPFLSRPDDNDLGKQWVVEYGVWSEREERIKRKRIVLTGKTIADRMADSKAVIKELTELLKKGAVVDALRKEPPAAAAGDGITVKTPLRQAIETYLAYKEKTTKKNSYRTYKSSLKVLQQYLLDTPGLKNVQLGQFHPSDAQHFLDQTIMKYGLSNRGHNNAKDNAQAVFLHWMTRVNRIGTSQLLTNPFENLDDKVTISGKHTAYTDQQRVEFEAKCAEMGEHQLLLFVKFMFYTFFRPREELRNVQIGDIREHTIRVGGQQAKNNTEGYVEIPPPLEKIIQELKLRKYPTTYYLFSHAGVPGPQRVGLDYFYQHHVRVLAQLEWQGGNFDMYSWKHTGVIALWQATQNIRLVQHHCRHSTAVQTEDYLRDLGIIVRHTQIQDFPEF